LWRKGGPLLNDPTSGVSPSDYGVWRAHFGETTFIPASTLTRGLVHYVTSFSGAGVGSYGVPEPTSVILVGIGIAAALAGGRNNFGRHNHLSNELWTRR